MDDTGEPLRPAIERDGHSEEEVPVGEIGRSVDRIDVPNQLAFAALGLLLSDDSGFITGTSIAVDGGYLAT